VEATLAEGGYDGAPEPGSLSYEAPDRFESALPGSGTSIVIGHTNYQNIGTRFGVPTGLLKGRYERNAFPFIGGAAVPYDDELFQPLLSAERGTIEGAGPTFEFSSTDTTPGGAGCLYMRPAR